MSNLAHRKIVLGVSGGIATYKAAELTRRLQDAGAQVQVVMTRAAQQFVTPLTFQALSGSPVRHSLLDPAAEAAMGHIELARWADLILVAPASANFISRLAHGFADDLLTTLCLASDARLAVAPAMNRIMWQADATQANVKTLMARAVAIWGPGCGAQACGESGSGRMLEPLELVQHAANCLAHGALVGYRVIVTAGPTREPIDPVRYISNYSSGKMGFALAAAAQAAGADVTLISGPVALAAPPAVQRVDIETTEELLESVKLRLADCDIFIAAAAVADYRPQHPAPQKIKKTGSQLTLNLCRNPDVLSYVSSQQPRPFCVGFAAETEQLEDHAKLKLDAKQLDMICANQVAGAHSAFDADDNELTVLLKHHRQRIARAPKAEVARTLIDMIANQLKTTT